MEAVPAPSQHRAAYIKRIQRVLEHIGAHLDQPLDLQTLADVAHFSPWHFHRVFQAVTGETLADCVRRRRLEAAAQALLSQPPRQALSIALEVGFASAEVFTRAFRTYFGMTPTAWRQGGWTAWAAAYPARVSKIRQDASKPHQATLLVFRNDPQHWPIGGRPTRGGPAMQVELKTLAPARLACMRNVGITQPGIGQLWGRFMTWLGQHPQPGRNMYGIMQDDPEVTPADKCRYDVGIEVDSGFKSDGQVQLQDFAGGQYGCALYTGDPTGIGRAWIKMYAAWLPASGREPADGPAVELYEPDFVVDEKAGTFRCWLCVPVKPM